MKKYLSITCVVFTLLLTIMLSDAFSMQFDASVAPKGSICLNLFSDVFVTNVRFDNTGAAVAIPSVSAIGHVRTHLGLYYSLTDSLMTGFMLPVDYMRKSYTTQEIFESKNLANPWIVIKYQLLPKPICFTPSIRIKLPIWEIEPIKEKFDTIEEEFDTDDKQIDIYPIFYLDLQFRWLGYIYSQIGYKYRMKNDTIKPRDELKVCLETGYAIVPGVIRIFTCSDYTRYFRGKTGSDIIDSGYDSGYIYNLGAGIRFMIGRSLKMEVMTKADPFGRNQFRGIGGHLGIMYVLD